jgi:uncharacterized membrane protein
MPPLHERRPRSPDKNEAMASWAAASPAIIAAFLASLVEVVEAFTVVLAASTVRGWRPPVLGAAAGLLVLGVIVVALGPLLAEMPLQPLQLVIGVLLLLFGLRWLRKAILRSAGVIALHDEELAYSNETRQLASSTAVIAGLAAFKAVLLEGLEVVFIVIAVGAGRGLLVPASLGAAAACVTVLAIGAMIRRPLKRVPENTLKFAVGVILSAFGVFWTGEGLGVAWPGSDLAIVVFALLFLLAGLSLGRMAARRAKAAVP